MILESVKHGPLIWPTIKENGVIRTKKYAELSATEKIQPDCDMKETNIILQGLPSDIYSLVNHHRVAKDLWEKVQLLMQGTSLTKQERECKLYDAFDKFTHIKGESLHQYYLRFTQLINDMNIYKMKMKHFQVITKLLNSLPPKWSKFVTDVKLVKDLHTTNFDQLRAYPTRTLSYQEDDLDAYDYDCDDFFTAKAVLMANLSSYGSDVLSAVPRSENTHTDMLNQSVTMAINLVSKFVKQSSSSSQYSILLFTPRQRRQKPDVLSCKQGDDPINVINKMMSFLSTVVTSYFPTTNNQQRNSSNPRQQATILDERVTVQPVQGDKLHLLLVTSQDILNLKRKRDTTWFRDKVLLVEAQGNGKVLNEEELEFLADTGVAEGPVTHTVITHNAVYQVDDLDAYDSDCDNFSTSKAVLMANLSSYGSDVLFEVPHSENNHTDMLNQSMQEMSYYEQTHLVNYPENKITSDSNIIPYSQYLLVTQNAAIQDTNSFTQQDAMILSVFEQLSNQVTNCNKVNKDNLIANKSLSAELEDTKNG
ncbi:hypothetical protein Tco_0112217 [Tanacetum coccineum]